MDKDHLFKVEILQTTEQLMQDDYTQTDTLQKKLHIT